MDELNKKANGGKKLKATPNYEEAKDCKAYIVIVPLLLDENKNPDFSVLESAFRSIRKNSRKKETWLFLKRRFLRLQPKIL